MGIKFQEKPRTISKDENPFALKIISNFPNFVEAYALIGTFQAPNQQNLEEKNSWCSE